MSSDCDMSENKQNLKERTEEKQTLTMETSKFKWSGFSGAPKSRYPSSSTADR